MWKIINKTRVRSIADLTANGVWLINYTYSRYYSKCLKFQSNPSNPSAQGRLEPKGTVPSLLQPPLHTQDLPPYLKKSKGSLSCQLHTRHKSTPLPCKVQKNKRWDLVRKERINKSKAICLLISRRRQPLSASGGGTHILLDAAGTHMSYWVTVTHNLN